MENELVWTKATVLGLVDEIKEGDLVRLKSGGPTMTVSALYKGRIDEFALFSVKVPKAKVYFWKETDSVYYTGTTTEKLTSGYIWDDSIPVAALEKVN